MGSTAVDDDQALSGLRDKHRLELESLTLTSQPFKTLTLFVLAIGQSIRSTCSCVLKEGARLKSLVLLVVTTWVLFLVIDGPHDKNGTTSIQINAEHWPYSLDMLEHMQELLWYARFGLWWNILGVASSIGLGCLHGWRKIAWSLDLQYIRRKSRLPKYCMKFILKPFFGALELHLESFIHIKPCKIDRGQPHIFIFRCLC